MPVVLGVVAVAVAVAVVYASADGGFIIGVVFTLAGVTKEAAGCMEVFVLMVPVVAIVVPVVRDRLVMDGRDVAALLPTALGHFFM